MQLYVVEVKLLFTVQFDINIIIDAVEKKLTLLDCKSSEFSSERDPHKPVSAIQTHFCPLKVV